MSRTMIMCVAASMLVSNVYATSCSAKCKACCPVGLFPDKDNDCAVKGQPGHPKVCSLDTPTCKGTVPQKCPPFPQGTIRADGAPLSKGFLTEGAPAWVGTPSKFDIIPKHIEGLPIAVPPVELHENTEIEFECPEGLEVTACAAYVFIYSCPPCESELGGIPAELLSDKWIASRCAPRFYNHEEGPRHRMITFTKRVLPGHKVSFRTEHDAKNVAFGISHEDVDCSKFVHPTECNNGFFVEVGEHVCSWDAGSGHCRSNICGNRPHGPQPPLCNKCLSADEFEIPM